MRQAQHVAGDALDTVLRGVGTSGHGAGRAAEHVFPGEFIHRHDVDLGEERGLFDNLVLQTLLQGRFDRELDIHGRHAVAGGELVTHLIEFQAGILSHGTS